MAKYRRRLSERELDQLRQGSIVYAETYNSFLNKEAGAHWIHEDASTTANVYRLDFSTR